MITTVGGLWSVLTPLSLLDRPMLMVLASEGAPDGSVSTAKPILVPEGVPAGNVTVPEAGW